MGLLDPPVDQTTKIARRAIAALDAANTSQVNVNQAWVFLGDSTGDASDEWIFLLLSGLASRYPNLGFQYLGWDGSAFYTTSSGSGASAWSNSTVYTSGTYVTRTTANSKTATFRCQIASWSAQSYATGSVVNYSSHNYTANASCASGDVPGTSGKWTLTDYPDPLGGDSSIWQFVSSTVQTATGGYPTVTFYNGSVKGTSFEYMQGKVIAQGQVVDPDVVVVNTGHNESTLVSKDFEIRYQSTITTIRRIMPRAELVLCTQNPQVSPATNAGTYQAQRRASIHWLASVYGCDVLDAYQSFIDTGSVASYINADGVHPTQSGTYNGSQLWANRALKAFAPLKGANPTAQPRLTFTTSEKNLLANPDFATYTTSPGVPDSWTGNNATCSKDTTNREPTYSWGCKIVPTATTSGAGAVYLEQVITPALVADIRSRWVTAFMRVWIPNGQSVNNAILKIQDGSTSTNTTWLSNPNLGSSHWFDVVCRHFVSSSASGITVRFHGDFATTPSSSSNITIQKASLGLGLLPIAV
jgi:lysophospholipase L1-like esterase